MNEKKPAAKKKLPFYLNPDWIAERRMVLLGKVMRKVKDGNYQLVIYPHEAAKLLKKTIRSAQRVLKIIRDKNGKPPRMPVTMKEFCDHFGFDEEMVKKELAG